MDKERVKIWTHYKKRGEGRGGWTPANLKDSTSLLYKFSWSGIYLCIMCTFFSQILPLKSRCTLLVYKELFVFI